MKIFFEKLMSNKDLKDIPANLILQVAIVVFEIINAGECYHNRKEEIYVD